MENLPFEIYEKIISNLTFKDIVKSLSVSKKFNEASQSVLKSITKLQLLKDQLYYTQRGTHPIFWFDNQDIITVKIKEQSENENMWQFLVKYCTKLQLIDAPESSIDINDLLNLPSTLKYISIDEVNELVGNEFEIINKFTNICIFNYDTSNGNLLESLLTQKYTQFIPISSDLQYADSVGLYPRIGCKYAYCSVENLNYFKNYPIEITQTLRRISVDISISIPENIYVKTSFPNLVELELNIRGISYFDSIAKIFIKSTNLKDLCFSGPFDPSLPTMYSFIYSFSKLSDLKLDLTPRGHGLFKVPICRSLVRLAVRVTSTVQLDISNSTSLKFIKIHCYRFIPCDEQFNFPNLIFFYLKVKQKSDFISIMKSFSRCKSLLEWQVNFMPSHIPHVLSKKQTKDFFIHLKNIPFSNLRGLSISYEPEYLGTTTIIDFEFTMRTALAVKKMQLKRNFNAKEYFIYLIEKFKKRVKKLEFKLPYIINGQEYDFASSFVCGTYSPSLYYNSNTSFTEKNLIQTLDEMSQLFSQSSQLNC